MEPPAVPEQNWIRRNRKTVMWGAAWVATWLLGMLAGYLGLPAPPPLIVEADKPAAPFDNLDEFTANKSMPMGWVNDSAAIEAAAATFPVQVFSQTPAGAATDLPSEIFLWKYHEKLMGAPPPLKDQNPAGSCVGFGTTTAVERTLAAGIVARGGDKSEFSFFSEEVTYAGSRVEIGGGRIRGDGSNGSWAARFVTEYGMVPKGKYGKYDLTEYSASRAQSWNYSGVPDELEPVARKFPVKSAARITNIADAKAALASGYGIEMSSSLAVGRQRDANGVARASGKWGHCMCIDGYHMDGTTLYFHVENSWSKVGYHVGPVGWGNPTVAGFWINSDSVDRALKQGDSYAFSGATGFPARKLPDWFVRADVGPEVFRHDVFAQAEARLAW